MALTSETLPVLIPHFHKRMTGVSASAASVLRQQFKRDDLDIQLCGDRLDGLPEAITKRAAIAWVKQKNREGRRVIIHLRRNSEMQFGLFLRDVLRLDVKLIFTSAAKRIHSALPRWLISRMDGVIATSDEAAELVPHVMATIPHGVDIELFAPAMDRQADWQSLGLGGARGIATIGRVRHEKGTDRFVDALITLLPNRPDCHGVIIGLEKPSDRAFGDQLRQKLRGHDLLDRVHFMGALPISDVTKILPAMSLLVAPPRYEGYGLTVLEAMASGVPVVATDTGAFATMLEGSVGGMVVTNEDGPHIAQAMAEYLDHPALLSAVGLEARQRAVENFSSIAESNAITDCYYRLSSV